MRPNQIVAHIPELCEAMNDALTAKWRDHRGLEIISIALGSVTLPKDDEELIKELQRKNVLARNPGMAGATLVEAQAEAMKAAAGNANGAAMGFYGLNMAANAGGMNAQGFYNMNQQQQAQQAQQAPQGGWTCPNCGKPASGKFCPECGTPKPQADGWTCPKCGAHATGKFCPECGTPKPQADGWTCSCGTLNKGKFCANCGKPKPAGTPKYKCDKCGWEPKDPTNPPKFCPECGDLFDEKDKQ